MFMPGITGGAWHPHFFYRETLRANRRLALGFGLSTALHVLLLVLALSALPHGGTKTHEHFAGKLIARLIPATARDSGHPSKVSAPADSAIRAPRLVARVKPEASRSSPAIPPARVKDRHYDRTGSRTAPREES